MNKVQISVKSKNTAIESERYSKYVGTVLDIENGFTVLYTDEFGIAGKYIITQTSNLISIVNEIGNLKYQYSFNVISVTSATFIDVNKNQYSFSIKTKSLQIFKHNLKISFDLYQEKFKNDITSYEITMEEKNV
ncbi:MAG: hypothetical protein RR578_02850 [Bacilli bacterium]